jgi:hypothetical protein
MIPKINKQTAVYIKDQLKKYDKIMAPINVMITSAIATPNNLYEWIPFLGSPRAFLYLHKSTIYIIM